MAGDPFEFIGPGRTSERNRRSRIAAEVDPRLRGWLQRTAVIHAGLTAVVRLYATPTKAGGQSNEGDVYASRAAAGDPSLLADALGTARDRADQLRAEVLEVMDSAPPTPHPPGTTGKVDAMVERAAKGLSLFVRGDAKPSRD